MHGAETIFFLALLGTVVVAAPLPWQEAGHQAVSWLRSSGWPVVVYAGSRIVIFLVAGLDALITHRSPGGELSLFDGQWYLRLASHGYPAQALHAKSTLGFLPLYPMVIRGLASMFSLPLLVAALIAAGAGGGLAPPAGVRLA